jgi:hypothetical protein
VTGVEAILILYKFVLGDLEEWSMKSKSRSSRGAGTRLW